ncbi:hexose transporter protein [Colletotrichum karsti]|uniref:Hexose transporter protein n=1 Tax=Colletotrichum karsti TaxID=1095194 RepID=A0A9P6I3X0_9PEZI|nr:hexose transporter protein [Colletotrichum karsti]KAF9875375.1 hexose transporter protein [Colletotrichum karsti]
MSTVADLVQLDDFQNIFSLKGKVAVISGGSRGLGLHTASGFLQSGCSRVYIVARSEGPLNDAAKALNALPNISPDAQAIAIVADISTQVGCIQMVDEISKTTDHVDILVANAGATFIGHMDAYREEDFDRVMRMNVSSVFFSAQKLSPLLQAGGTVQDPSRIIMVSSVADVVVGDMGEHGTYAYAASKAALVGPGVTLAMTFTMPESPRWLVRHSASDEALRILARYHANGDVDDPLVRLEYEEIMETLRADELNSATKYTDFSLPNNRPRLVLLVAIAIGTNWVGNGIITYYLSTILNTIGIRSTEQQAGLNLGLQIWNLILSTSAALSVDRVGRRPLWLTSTVGMLLSFIVVMGLSAAYDTQGQRNAVGLAVIPFLFVFFGFYDLAWTPLSYMYTVEILPYNLRTKGQAIFSVVQGLANAVNQWVNPIILDAIHWKYYAVYIGILAFYCVIIYRRFPETKGLTIEEIVIIFDGDRAKGVSPTARVVRDEPRVMGDCHSIRSEHADDISIKQNGMEGKSNGNVTASERV